MEQLEGFFLNKCVREQIEAAKQDGHLARGAEEDEFLRKEVPESPDGVDDSPKRGSMSPIRGENEPTTQATSNARSRVESPEFRIK